MLTFFPWKGEAYWKAGPGGGGFKENVRYLKLVSGHNGELSHRTPRICQLIQSLHLSNALEINKPGVAKSMIYCKKDKYTI